MALPRIRTMRHVWDRLAGRKSRAATPRGQGIAGGIVRVQDAPGSRFAGNTATSAGEAAARHSVHPWLFRRVAKDKGRRVKCRVKTVAAPKAEIRKTEVVGALVVLYSLPHVLKESIEVELKGDVLRLAAYGSDPDKGAPFEVFSETLLPEVFSKPHIQHAYAGTILEIMITPTDK